MQMRSAIVSGLFFFLTPAAALACPYCAGRSGGGIGQGIAIGLFVMFPFVVATVVYRIVKAGEPGGRKHRPALGLEADASPRTG